MDSIIYSHILGCLVGGAIGDAFGAAVETAEAERLRQITGGDWISEFLATRGDDNLHYLGQWEPDAPRGTSTDDTRLNQAFVECAVRHEGHVTADALARDYISRYRRPADFYPRHPDFAAQQYFGLFRLSCAYLGVAEEPDRAVVSMAELQGNARTDLYGLISLAPAGLLYANHPEAAYRFAFDLDVFDVGYARDATAVDPEKPLFLTPALPRSRTQGCEGKKEASFWTQK